MTSTVDIKPARLSASELERNFADIHPPMDEREALAEAHRCLFCYDAPCVEACPTKIDIPGFIRKITTANLKGSARDILSQNIMGGMCARVCPTEVLCEGACVRKTQDHKPIRIGALQRYSTDWLFRKEEQIFQRGRETGKRIAVVGGGPAGLACTHRLARFGHQVVIFEARSKLSGLNEYGIAAYKTVAGFAQRETAYILGLGGIETRMNTRFGKEVVLAQLRREFDAVFLGIGLGAVNELDLGESRPQGVHYAIEFIEQLRQTENPASLPVGRKVLAIGGGSTAIDIAVQSKRLGAEDVTLVYRRGPKQMGATEVEREFAQLNDVRVRNWLQPREWITDQGHVRGMVFEYTRLNGAGKLVGKGEFLELEADVVFLALGQKLNSVDFGTEEDLQINKGRIEVDTSGATGIPGIWAGGDCTVAGKDLTVHAVEQGTTAAVSIHEWLQAK